MAHEIKLYGDIQADQVSDEKAASSLGVERV
jgi:hypothetical protein